MARDALRNQVKALIEVEPMLDSAATVAKELHDKTTSTAILAEKVSAKVRSLDMAKVSLQQHFFELLGIKDQSCVLQTSILQERQFN